MFLIATIATSLVSLALVSAIYYCNIRARPGSWLRGDMLAMILLAMLTGLYPPAAAATVVSLWKTVSGEFGLDAVLSAGVELASLAAVIATALVFRALVKATYRARRAPTTLTPVTPLTPRPAAPPPPNQPLPRAA